LGVGVGVGMGVGVGGGDGGWCSAVKGAGWEVSLQEEPLYLTNTIPKHNQPRTHTPHHNRQVDMLRPGLLGSHDHFGDKYCLPGSQTRQQALAAAGGGRFRRDIYRWMSQPGVTGNRGGWGSFVVYI